MRKNTTLAAAFIPLIVIFISFRPRIGKWVDNFLLSPYQFAFVYASINDLKDYNTLHDRQNFRLTQLR